MTLIDSLDHLYRILSRAWNKSDCRPGLLSHSEYEYLRALDRLNGAQVAKDNHHGAHLQDLAEILAVSKASASTAIARLEKRGLVERRACQYDARAQHIILTTMARDALQQETAAYDDIVRQMKTTLSDAEFRQLRLLLAKLTDCR